MRINHNIPALQASTNAAKTSNKLAKAMRNLSTGVRINSAADDAAGLAVANKLRNQVGGLNSASQNSLDGISLMQTAEGALGEIHSILQRMRELAVRASTGTLNEETGEDKAKIQLEIDELGKEIVDITHKTEYNNIKLLGGELGSKVLGGTTFPGLMLQVGAGKDMNLEVNIPNILDAMNSAGADFIGANLDYTTTAGATTAITQCDAAISVISDIRARLGAVQNRLQHTISSLDTTALNTEEARSRVEDTDMAKEMTQYSSMNVIQQAGLSILAQANQRPQAILQLMR